MYYSYYNTYTYVFNIYLVFLLGTDFFKMCIEQMYKYSSICLKISETLFNIEVNHFIKNKNNEKQPRYL